MVKFGRTPLNAHSSRNPDPDLSGWAGIEHEMITHDDASMSDYADDIDTMLVFAALFSAVVTTFATQTYQAFQPDNGTTTTNQLIAYQISLQGPPLNNSSVIGSTIMDLLSPQPSEAPTSARWINSLFFLSLVLSLAAALIGIMAKQWIREFLKWNSALDAPRSNVMVRQIRFEAWEQWRVEGILWSVPILLELAMVLFLAGISVLLWTLDDVVARLITVVVAVFLGLFALVTVLPVFIKRCPYKSPTSWVFVRLYVLVKDQSLSFLHKCSKTLRRWHSKNNSFRPWGGFNKQRSQALPVVRAWRDLDLDSCRIARWNGRSWPIYARLRAEEGAGELPLIPKPRHQAELWEIIGQRHAIRDICETFVLVRALSWVGQASQDPRVQRYISQSMQSIHPVVKETTEDYPDPIRGHVIADWCIVGSMLVSDVEPANADVLLTPTTRQMSYDQISWENSWRTASRVRVARTSLGQQKLLLPLEPSDLFWREWLWEDGKLASIDPTVRRLLAVDLKQIVTEAGNRDNFKPGLTHSIRATSYIPAWMLSESRIRSVGKILVMLEAFSEDQHRGDDDLLDGLRGIICTPRNAQRHLSTVAPDLQYEAFSFACQIAMVNVNMNTGLLEINPGSTNSHSYASLVRDYFTSHPSSWPNDEVRTFLYCAGRCSWRECVHDGQSRTIGVSRNLEKHLTRIHDIMRVLLSRGDFGVFETDANPTSFSICKDLILAQHPQGLAATELYKDLMHTIAQAYRYHKISVSWPEERRELHEIMRNIHRMPCNVETCPWNSHTCNRDVTCPLLKQSPLSQLRLLYPLSDAPLPYFVKGTQIHLKSNKRAKTMLGEYLRRVQQTASAPSHSPAEEADAMELGERAQRTPRSHTPKKGWITLPQLIQLLQRIDGILVRAPIPDNIFRDPRPVPTRYPWLDTPESPYPEPLAPVIPSEADATPRAVIHELDDEAHESSSLAPQPVQAAAPCATIYELGHETDSGLPSGSPPLAESQDSPTTSRQMPNALSEEESDHTDSIPLTTLDLVIARHMDACISLPAYEDLPPPYDDLEYQSEYRELRTMYDEWSAEAPGGS